MFLLRGLNAGNVGDPTVWMDTALDTHIVPSTATAQLQEAGARGMGRRPDELGGVRPSLLLKERFNK